MIYATLAGLFAGILFIFALLIYRGNISLIKSINGTSVKDKIKYARLISGILLLIDLGVVLSIAVELIFGPVAGVIVLIVSFIGSMIYGSKKANKHYR